VARRSHNNGDPQEISQRCLASVPAARCVAATARAQTVAPTSTATESATIGNFICCAPKRSSNRYAEPPMWIWLLVGLANSGVSITGTGDIKRKIFKLPLIHINLLNVRNYCISFEYTNMYLVLIITL